MLSGSRKAFTQIDRMDLDLGATMQEIRRLSIDDFGELLLELPNEELPHLSRILPRRTPDEVQHIWTGGSGISLLKQSISFINFLVANYTNITGNSLEHARVLDFGCGWGRLLRLMPFYSDAANVYGCDAWDTSLGHVRDAGISANLAKSDTEPSTLPFTGVTFDLIYSFSVFTHLSERIALAALSAMRNRISPSGLLVITIRPVDFWTFMELLHKKDFQEHKSVHESYGLSYLPHSHSAVSNIYGDTSISKAYMDASFIGWKVEHMGGNLSDPQQEFVCLRPN